MSGQANLNINIKSSGGDKARQDIANVANAVDRQSEKVSKRQEKREKASAERLDKSTSGVAATAIGTALGNAIPQTIGAFNRGIAQAFDPNLSPVEKELNLAKAGLDLIPFEGGAIPKALLEAQTQEIVGAARGTGSRINQLLGSAFRGSASLSEEEFSARFTPQIQRLKGFIEPQERARERGSQLIAGELGSFLDDFRQVLEDQKPGGQDTEATDANTKSNEDLKESVDKLTEAITVGSGANIAKGLIAGKVD